MSYRIGHGYDAHRLVVGRALFLGCVEIPFEKGLLGHSDADVLSHAIADALLGAAALGDIGQHFPDDDPACENMRGATLLSAVAEKLAAAGYIIENIDATLVAQAPKVAPYLADMRAAVGAALGISPAQVNLKATTEEGLGITGAGDAMCAHAVCLLRTQTRG